MYAAKTETKASGEWIAIGEHWNEIQGEMVAMERHYRTGETRTMR